MEKRLTLSDLEKLSLPGLPKSRKGLEKRAKRDGWVSNVREKSGGGREYSVSSLPKSARDALLRREAAVSAPLPVPAETAAVADPRFAKDWQICALEGRATVLAEVKRLQT